MSSIQKTATGYRAQVAVKGVRDSATFRTKREAEAWAGARETAIRADISRAPGERMTFRMALERYRDEVSPGKRGARWEAVRINALLRDDVLPLGKTLGSISPSDFAPWRDARVAAVQPGTVLREIGLLSSVLHHARKEWRALTDNPLADLRRPKMPDHREVLIGWRDVRAMLAVMGYMGGPIRSVSQAAAVCFLLALRTGMRAGELTGLTWDRVREDHVILPVTKTKPRTVPLSRRSQRLLHRMRGWDDRLVFGLSAQTLDALFRRYRQRAGLSGFTFHDSRHTAATMLARKLDVLDLCKMFGWANPKQAMTYYNPSPSDIAARLD